MKIHVPSFVFMWVWLIYEWKGTQVNLDEPQKNTTLDEKCNTHQDVCVHGITGIDLEIEWKTWLEFNRLCDLMKGQETHIDQSTLNEFVATSHALIANISTL